MRKKHLQFVLLVAAVQLSLGFVTRVMASTNLVVNGDFEQTNFPNGSNGGSVFGIGLPGWSLEPGGDPNSDIFQFAPNLSIYNPAPQSGNFGLWLDGSQGNGNEFFINGPDISQRITLDPGTYDFSLILTRRWEISPATQKEEHPASWLVCSGTARGRRHITCRSPCLPPAHSSSSFLLKLIRRQGAESFSAPCFFW
jgi:hypothetical protein